MINEKSYLALCFVIASLVMNGCSTTGPLSSQHPEELVAARAKARWDALIEGRKDDAYEYFAPEFRQITNLEQFKRRYVGQGIWQGAEVKKVACEERRCKITVDVHTRIRMKGVPQPIDSTSPVEEVWLWDESTAQWWYLPRI
jgi:hypothetical protein